MEPTDSGDSQDLANGNQDTAKFEDTGRRSVDEEHEHATESSSSTQHARWSGNIHKTSNHRNDDSQSLGRRESKSFVTPNTGHTRPGDEDVEEGKPEPANTIDPTEWKSLWLKSKVLVPMIVLSAFLLCTVTGLSIYSAKSQGLVTLNLNRYHDILEFGNINVGISSTWTVIPVFVFQVYILSVVTVVRTVSSRQPYVELRKPGGAPVDKTISLDYASEWATKAPWKAMKNGHFVLAYSFSIMLGTNLVFTALAAYLLFAARVQRESPLTVTQSHSFTTVHYNNNYDLTSAFDQVLGTRKYGGKLQSWTTLDKSILPFPCDDIPDTNNFSIHTTVFSAEMDCKVLEPPYEFEMAYTSDGWLFEAVDRGCAFNGPFAVPGTASRYLETINRITCGPDHDWSRHIVIAAIADPDAHTGGWQTYELHNKTAVSCIPSYYLSTGMLSIAIDSSKSKEPTINSFVPTTRTKFVPPPLFQESFEAGLDNNLVVEETPLLYATMFGDTVFNIAQILSPTSYFDGDILCQATEQTFTSVFAVTAQEYFIVPATPHKITGTVIQEETRLIVVLPVAYAMICILLMLLILLVWIWWYSISHASILYEEPKGILGMAALLRRSELIEMVGNVNAGACGGKVAECIRILPPRKELEPNWVFEHWDSPEVERLHLISPGFRSGLA